MPPVVGSLPQQQIDPRILQLLLQQRGELQPSSPLLGGQAPEQGPVPPGFNLTERGSLEGVLGGLAGS